MVYIKINAKLAYIDITSVFKSEILRVQTSMYFSKVEHKSFQNLTFFVSI